jgi:hypothetical protein
MIAHQCDYAHEVDASGVRLRDHANNDPIGPQFHRIAVTQMVDTKNVHILAF